MKGEGALYRIKSYKKGNGIALAFTGKMLSDLGLDGPCELDVNVRDGEIVLSKVNRDAVFPLRFGKWTFDNWSELAGFAENQVRMETAGNGGDGVVEASESAEGMEEADNSALF